MKKARLGFTIYSDDNELLVDEDKDREFKEKQLKWERRQRELLRKRKCYNKNKDKYNKQRRDKSNSILGKFNQSKNKATKCGQKWELSLEEWQQVWIDAGWVIVPGTVSPSNPRGVRRTAFSMRGPNRFENTMMARKDLTLPWSVDNVKIVYRSAPLVGSAYHSTTGT